MRHLYQKWLDLSIKVKIALLMSAVVMNMCFVVAIVTLQLDTFTQKSKGIMNEYQEITGFMEAFSAENICLESYIRPVSSSNVLENYQNAIAKTDVLLKNLMPNLDSDKRDLFVLKQAIQNTMVYYRTSQQQLLALEDSSQLIEHYLSLKTQAAYIDDYARQLLDSRMVYGGRQWQQIETANSRAMNQFLILLFVSSLFLLSICLVFNHYIVKPLNRLSHATDTISAGCYDAPPIQMKGNDELGRTAHSFNLMQAEIRRTIQALEKQSEIERKLLEKEVETEQMHRKLQEGRFAQLQSQINPHFLFNILNTIAAMAREEHAPLSEDLIVRLSNFFRYSLSSDEKLVPLGREIQLLRDYIELQETRYGERITMEIRFDPTLKHTIVPKFILQPLVENSILHGLKEYRSGGLIRVRVFSSRKGITILVSDNGCGFVPCKQPLSSNKHRSVGLINIIERVELVGGKVSVFSRLGIGTVVKILLKEENHV